MIRPSPLLAMIGFSMVGNSSFVLQPMVVGGLVDEPGFTERQAGFVASVELAGLSIGMLLLIGMESRIPRSWLAVGAIAVVALANVFACAVHRFELMLVTRFITGFGSAMALAVFLAMGASQPRPETTFAVVNAISIAYSGVLTTLVPAIWRLPGLFLILATVALLMSPLLGLDARESTARTQRHVAGGVLALLSRQIVLLLLMMLLLYAGHGAIWAYQQRIGVGLGLATEEVGEWIGLSMLTFGVGGSLLARVLGMLLGRVWPQVLSLGIAGVAAVLLVYANTPTLFAASCGLIALSRFYGLPYQMGLLAAVDPHGRANMAGFVMANFGSAPGPAVAAILIGHTGHVAIGAFAAVCYVLSVLLVLPTAIGLSRAVPAEAR